MKVVEPGTGVVPHTGTGLVAWPVTGSLSQTAAVVTVKKRNRSVNWFLLLTHSEANSLMKLTHSEVNSLRS